MSFRQPFRGSPASCFPLVLLSRQMNGFDEAFAAVTVLSFLDADFNNETFSGFAFFEGA